MIGVVAALDPNQLIGSITSLIIAVSGLLIAWVKFRNGKRSRSRAKPTTLDDCLDRLEKAEA